MLNNITLAGILNWNDPLTYLYLVVFLILIASIQVILSANHFIKEAGGELKISLFNYSSFLKWASTHEIKLGIIMLFIVLSGVIWAIYFGS